jgi:hypothetical protein
MFIVFQEDLKNAISFKEESRDGGTLEEYGVFPGR